MLENIIEENESSEYMSIPVTVLGEKDPKLMSREEFETSPELLYHGCSKQIKFENDFDYNSKEYLTNNDGSTTLGFGFYAVDNRDAAKSYSKQRQNDLESKEENIVSVLPYNARMLDFRQEKNSNKNIPVSKEFALEWREYFNEYLNKRSEREGNVGEMFNQFENEYLKYLDRVLDLKDSTLRVLLRTEASLELKSGSAPSPLWSSLFSKFVIENGFDGIIYNEKVEGSDNICTSYVFYNLKKIGTYNSWHKMDSLNQNPT